MAGQYGKVMARFWQTGSGKKLRGIPSAQIVALYLFTCEQSNMSGLYHLALPTMCHETGLSMVEATKGLAILQREDIAHYDQDDELVYLPEGARVRVGDSMSEKDKRRKALIGYLDEHRGHRFYQMFIDRYAQPFNLGSPFDAPSMPLPTTQEAPSMGHPHDQRAAGAGAGDTTGTGAAAGAKPAAGSPGWVRSELDKRPELSLVATDKFAELLLGKAMAAGTVELIPKALDEAAEKLGARDAVDASPSKEHQATMVLGFVKGVRAGPPPGAVAHAAYRGKPLPSLDEGPSRTEQICMAEDRMRRERAAERRLEQERQRQRGALEGLG